MKKQMTHASVFSGIGGPEVAATMLGWQNLFHCEINPFGRKVLDYWYPDSKSYEDITKTDFTEWRGRVDVLTGGFPCQPFSYAGKRRGAEDDRYLWPSMYRAIDEIQPTWVVAENVAGILTMVEQGEVSKVADSASLFDTYNDVRGRYELRETFTLQRICTDLESHGYSVQPVLIPACAVGAPHRRDRVFIVARRVAADTCSSGQSASEQQGERERKTLQQQSGEQSQHGTGSNGGQRNVTHTDCRTCDYGNSGIREDSKPQIPESGERDGEGVAEYEYLRSVNRWQAFPSVSPVHRGNDGLPFNVGDLTIPFSKWRTEALKAYGNAIVPQVMYEIFRAIEEVENMK